MEDIFQMENNSIKVYLDDERPCPEGWVLVKTADEAIEKLKTCWVTHISLDHDLALMHYAGHYETGEKTGYDVLLWLEEQLDNYPYFQVPIIMIHTMNPSAMVKMKQAARKIIARSREFRLSMDE